MNRWEKILHELGHASLLDDNQRFWLALALLRTGDVLRAGQCIAEGPLEFQGQVRTRILVGEVSARRQRHQEAEDMLTSCWSEAHANENLKLGWKLAARRVRQPSEKFRSLLARIESTMAADVEPAQPTTMAEWELWLGLDKNRSDAQAHFKWLEWCKNQKCDPGQLREVALRALQNCSLSAGSWRRWLDFFVKEGDWEFILSSLFEPCTKVDAEKAALWERLHRACPREWRPGLLEQMRRHTSRHPLRELEEFVAQYGGRHETA